MKSDIKPLCDRHLTEKDAVGSERPGTTDKAFHPIPQRFLRHLGAITGGPPDLSSRKGFSRR